MGQEQAATDNGPMLPAHRVEGRLRNRLPRRRWFPGIYVPPRIWFALLCSAASIGIGLYKGINLLVLVGYAVPVLVGFNARAAARNLPSLSVRRRFLGPLFAGTACEVEMHVHNLDSRSGQDVQLKERGPNHKLCWLIPELPADASLLLRGKLLLGQRGRYPVSALEASSGYPFGLLERRRTLAPAEDWFVFPSLGILHRTAFRRFVRSLNGRGDRTRTNLRRHPAARDEFHGLRPFRTGDSPRAIHWRTSARRNELMVREYEDFAGENLVLVFDPAVPPAAIGSARFEAAVSFAATIAWEWCRRRGDRFALVHLGIEPTVVAGVTGPELGRRVLAKLALTAPVQAGVGQGGLRSLGQAALPRGPVVLVSVLGAARAGPLQTVLRRPVTVLDPGGAAGYDFYEPPGPSPEG